MNDLLWSKLIRDEDGYQLIQARFIHSLSDDPSVQGQTLSTARPNPFRGTPAVQGHTRSLQAWASALGGLEQDGKRFAIDVFLVS